MTASIRITVQVIVSAFSNKTIFVDYACYNFYHRSVNHIIHLNLVGKTNN